MAPFSHFVFSDDYIGLASLRFYPQVATKVVLSLLLLLLLLLLVLLLLFVVSDVSVGGVCVSDGVDVDVDAVVVFKLPIYR